MAKQKQQQLSKFDYTLFMFGFLSTTFLTWYVGLLFSESIEAVVRITLYLVITIMYIQTLHPSSRTHSSVQLARVVSYIGIVMATLIMAFFASFAGNFRW